MIYKKKDLFSTELHVCQIRRGWFCLWGGCGVSGRTWRLRWWWRTLSLINTHSLSAKLNNDSICHVSCPNTKLLMGRSGPAMNQRRWHKDSACTGADPLGQVPASTHLHLTCRKLEVWGFHFSSGLPCQVLRMLKQTWRKHIGGSVSPGYEILVTSWVCFLSKHPPLRFRSNYEV